ncbi:MAG: hypothetical protein WCT45_01800 [Candidatus Paceibacterota bacterium]|jgi:tetratricopeptide (TPR) repeat protein
MQISKNQWIIAGVGICAVLLLGILWRSAQKRTAEESLGVPPVATSSAPVAVATASTTPTVAYTGPFPVNTADTISSWVFKGQYADSAVLMKQATDDNTHLSGLIGKGQYDDYDLYNGLGNNYSMLGEGKLAYENYNRAFSIHPDKGLGYVNLAHLMEALGAYHTAADAYTKAVRVEAGQLEYHLERLKFLTARFANDNTVILAAFTDASKQFGDNAAILALEAEWLAGEHRYADAIKAWETVKKLSPENRQVSIDAEIARLTAKQ